MPRVSRPAAPASARKQGVSAVQPQRQLFLGDDLLAHQVGQRAPRRWGSASGRRWCWNRSSANFGSWPVPKTASSSHQQRRRDLGVAVLAGLQVEHELAERALQPRQLALQHHEARAAHPGGGLEVHQAQAPRRGRRGPSGWRWRAARPSGGPRHCRARPRPAARRAPGCSAGAASRSRSSSPASRSTSACVGQRRPSAPRPRPSGAAASASSFWALAWPISLEASLRSAWAVCSAVWAARSLRVERRGSRRPRPDEPFAAQACS